jgi:hypothetical protein
VSLSEDVRAIGERTENEIISLSEDMRATTLESHRRATLKYSLKCIKTA